MDDPGAVSLFAIGWGLGLVIGFLAGVVLAWRLLSNLE